MSLKLSLDVCESDAMVSDTRDRNRRLHRERISRAKFQVVLNNALRGNRRRRVGRDVLALHGLYQSKHEGLREYVFQSAYPWGKCMHIVKRMVV